MSTASARLNRSSGGASTVYRSSWRHRAISVSGVVVVAFLYGSALIQEGFPWGELYVHYISLGVVLLGCAEGFSKRIEIGEETLQKRRLLWTNTGLRWNELRRVHLPTTENGLWLYTDPDGDPALTVEGHYERIGDLALQVTGRLPDGAEVTDPNRRLEKYRNEDGDPDGDPRGNG